MEAIPFGLIQSPAFIREDDRGRFEELINVGVWESLIHGTMQKDAVMGHHYHADTILFFYLLEGTARITTVDVTTTDRREYMLEAGQGFLFRPSEARAIQYLEDARFLILKSRRYDPENPDLIPYEVQLSSNDPI
jgi:dTDP-4-dehydrorhamnose 3,5-epimerase-like enzyme